MSATDTRTATEPRPAEVYHDLVRVSTESWDNGDKRFAEVYFNPAMLVRITGRTRGPGCTVELTDGCVFVDDPAETIARLVCQALENGRGL